LHDLNPGQPPPEAPPPLSDLSRTACAGAEAKSDSSGPTALAHRSATTKRAFTCCR